MTMPWKSLTPPDPTSATAKDQPTVRMSVVTGRNNIPKVLLSLNGKAQQQFWRNPVAGQPFRVELGTGEQTGTIRIVADSNGKFIAIRQPHGSAQLKITPWARHLRQACASTVCKVHWDGQGLLVDLPSWAGDQAAKAQMEAEFGLKRPS